MKIDIFNTDKKYGIIYADPPWKYQDKSCEGACEKHYPTMKIDDICKLPIKQIADKNSVLFMWATYPMLKEALKLIEAWGFTYKSIGFQWIKQNKSGNGYFFGLGRWTRGNTECCLIATKGKPKRINAGISQLVFSPIEEHSKKPDCVREKITCLIGGDIPKIELFAREAADGWDCWGNEAPDD